MKQKDTTLKKITQNHLLLFVPSPLLILNINNNSKPEFQCEGVSQASSTMRPAAQILWDSAQLDNGVPGTP